MPLAADRLVLSRERLIGFATYRTRNARSEHLGQLDLFPGPLHSSTGLSTHDYFNPISFAAAFLL